MATVKAYRRGTHRTRRPAETIAEVGRFRAELGITRLANITGLDYLGIPVFTAIRPNARSLSLSSGKGIDQESAVASALMEAAELAHAEQPKRPTIRTSWARLRRDYRVADPRKLPRMRGAHFDRRTVLSWINGRDLFDHTPVWLPYDLVHTDYTRRGGNGIFARGSNGLASGNDFDEAVCSGLCEVIERDATALWSAQNLQHRAVRRLLLDTVDDPDCRMLLDGLARKRIAVAVWDATSDVGVPCFICTICEARDNTRSALGVFWGAGCHLDRGVALSRALTEAAQSRLTLIAGSRDDLAAGDYDRTADPVDILLDRWEQIMARQRFDRVPSLATQTFKDDIRILLERLAGVGIDSAIAVDLTDQRFGLAVVRIVVPGLEAHDPHGRIGSGRRLANPTR